MKAYQNAMTQNGVHFVPWFAKRSRGKRNRPVGGLAHERQTDCTGRGGNAVGGRGGLKKSYICG